MTLAKTGGDPLTSSIDVQYRPDPLLLVRAYHYLQEHGVADLAEMLGCAPTDIRNAVQMREAS